MLDRRALAGIFVLLTIVLWLNFPTDDYSTGGGISPVIESKTAAPAAYSLSVLFIGNSYTYVNNIPKQLVDIASNERGNNTQLIVQSVTRGGIGLKELWDDGNAQTAIESRHWDYVVLQEQSFWAMFLPSVEATSHYAKLFTDAIRQADAKPLLYLTWVREPDSSWYTADHTAFLRNPDYMLTRFVTRTEELSKKIGAQVVPVGVYWQQALAQDTGLKLYEHDGSHPSLQGAYLAALTFYRTLTGHDISKLSYQPEGISPEDGQKIRMIVAQ